jgi:fumarylacetoacetate (FAA) hydrolase family protein
LHDEVAVEEGAIAPIIVVVDGQYTVRDLDASSTYVEVVGVVESEVYLTSTVPVAEVEPPRSVTPLA